MNLFSRLFRVARSYANALGESELTLSTCWPWCSILYRALFTQKCQISYNNCKKSYNIVML